MSEDRGLKQVYTAFKIPGYNINRTFVNWKERILV